MMETSSLVPPRSGGRSRFSKALPAPPPSLQETKEVRPAVLPVRQDSLLSRPAPPPKDPAPTKIPSNMASKVMEAPLPALPVLSRVTSPPNYVPKRKPVGSGTSVQSPPLDPYRSGEISPVESISSLLSAYGTEESEDTRYSMETTATKHSFAEQSPTRVLPKERLGAAVTKMDIVSPLSLPTPVSSTMDTSRQQQADGLLTPPMNDSQQPTTPSSSMDTTVLPGAPDLVSESPNSISNQPPSHPQLWRRRSLKTDKPLTVHELKLTSSHGSTAASSHQVNDPKENELPPLPNSRRPFDESKLKSPTANGFQSFPGRNIKPTTPQKPLPRNPEQENMGNKKSKERLEGFAKYARDVDEGINDGANQPPKYSTAKMSPEINRPPTPDYAKDEPKSDGPVAISPTSQSPMTPPDDFRPLSIIQEDPAQSMNKGRTAVAPKEPSPKFPLRGSSKSGAGALAPSHGHGLPRSPRPIPSPGATNLAPTTNVEAANPLSSAHGRSPSATSARSAASVRSLNAHPRDDGDTSTLRASPRPTTSASQQTTSDSINNDDEGPAPIPGAPNYFPMVKYDLKPITPGTVLPAPPLKTTQLECFAGHPRFLPSRNEGHPLACQSCHVMDRAVRFTCSFCGVRICPECRDVLMMNGRDLKKLVEMLKS